MSQPSAAPDAAGRFRNDAVKLLARGPAGSAPARIALAVSGGPDSLALLLLAHAAFPGRIAAVTVDHGLRAESAAEAIMVANVCAHLGVPHTVLQAKGLPASKANVQARARVARYWLMAEYCRDQGIAVLMTAHHADDQAETLLMRLARGSGVAGLSGIRAMRVEGDVAIVRPLLGWRKTELAAIVDAAGLSAADDPSNRSDAYDRTAARRLLGEADWLDPLRLAAAAQHLADAEDALQWTAEQAWRSRAEQRDEAIFIDIDGLPPELARRMVWRAIVALAPAARPDGPALDRLIAASAMRRESTLAGIRVKYGRKWRLAAAPPRRDGKS